MGQFLTKERKISVLEVLILAAMLAMCFAGCSSSYVPTAEDKAAHELRLQDNFHRMHGPAGVRGARHPHNLFYRAGGA